MKFTYEDTEYTLVDPDTWTTLEAVRLEEVSGQRPAALVVDFDKGGPLGVHGLVWLSLRRAGIDIAWDELVLPWIETVQSLKGDQIQEAPDPSTASTPRSAARGTGRKPRSQSAKK